MHSFGDSAPIEDLMRKFGFTPKKILAAARQQLTLAKRHAA
jgi:transketolase